MLGYACLGYAQVPCIDPNREHPSGPSGSQDPGLALEARFTTGMHAKKVGSSLQEIKATEACILAACRKKTQIEPFAEQEGCFDLNN